MREQFITFLHGHKKEAIMADITFTIPDNKIDRVKAAMAGLYPIPDADEDGTPDFTEAQWAKESVRRWIRDQVARWETKVAKDAVTVAPDDGIVS